MAVRNKTFSATRQFRNEICHMKDRTIFTKLTNNFRRILTTSVFKITVLVIIRFIGYSNEESRNIPFI